MLADTQEVITLPEIEQREVDKLDRLLKKLERLPKRRVPSLVSGSGEKIELPARVYEILKKVVELMAQGRALTLIPDNHVITTQRAADILGMSRPFFIKLLDMGAMAHHRVGNQRRVYLRDVLQFAHRREQDRRAALDRLSRDAFEAGLYENNKLPEGGRDN